MNTRPSGIAQHLNRATCTIEARGYIYAILVVFLFTGLTLVSRHGYNSQLKMLDLVALRFGIGGVILLPLLFKHGLPDITIKQAMLLAIFGGIGFAPIAYTGLELSSSANGSALLHGTLPLFALLVTSISDKKIPSISSSICIITITVGVLFMMASDSTDENPLKKVGYVTLLIGALSWTLYGYFSKKWSVPAIPATALVSSISMIIFVPLYLIFAKSNLLLVDSTTLVVQILFQGILLGAVSIFIYTKAVSALGETKTSLFIAIVPCLTTILSVVFLSEEINSNIIAGITLVTLGMCISSFRNLPKHLVKTSHDLEIRKSKNKTKS